LGFGIEIVSDMGVLGSAKEPKDPKYVHTCKKEKGTGKVEICA